MPLGDWLPLAPDTAYEIAGRVPAAEKDLVQVWIFQYGGGQLIHSTSFPAKDGRLHGWFHTDAKMIRFALGLRLAGSGRLNSVDVRMQLNASVAATINQAFKAEAHVLTRQLKELQDSLEKSQAKQNQNSLAQLEAFLRLQSYLGEDFVIPDVHGWAISPDFGLLLIELIEKNDYQMVVEFGSGTSTILIARAIATISSRLDGKPKPIQVAFEHSAEFYKQTEALLMRSRLIDAVDLELAALAPWVSPQGVEYQYYSCHSKLLQRARDLRSRRGGVLVVVDGPPAKTCRHARYPAVPILLSIFHGVTIDVLLDDYNRDEEQQIADMWVADLNEAGRPYALTAFELEKGACLLEIEGSAEIDAESRHRG
jgi:hypothetical protein